MSTPPEPRVVLTFAGSDPTGGAGVQADLLTLASLGCHPFSVITALTVQDTHGVKDVLATDAAWVESQANIVLDDVQVAAIKVGLIGSVDNVAAIARVARRHQSVPLVIDPVLASGRGDPLASAPLIRALREELLPLTTVLTPNSIEARRLVDADETTPLETCAALLIGLGAKHVLITGTHESTPTVTNTLYGGEGIVRSDDWERLPGSFHGSGCTLASALAATLANGLSLAEAVYAAQEYTWQSLAGAFRAGTGQAIPDRFFWARRVDAAAG